jgi:hypothetical protein
MASSATPADDLRELASGASQVLEQDPDWSIDDRFVEPAEDCRGCGDRPGGPTGFCARCSRDATDDVCGDGLN